MSLVLIALSSFLLALSGALVPGPLFTITISESARRGFIAGPLLILGHGLLEISIVLLIFFGIAPYLMTEGARAFVSLSGGIILVGMGIMTLKDGRRARLVLSVEESGRESRSGGLHPVFIGVIGSLSNPYWVIWWMTVGLGYLMSALKYGIPGVAAFFAGHILADLMWYSLISFAVARGRQMTGDRGYRYVLYGCGIFLIFFGVWFIIHA